MNPFKTRYRNAAQILAIGLGGWLLANPVASAAGVSGLITTAGTSSSSVALNYGGIARQFIVIQPKKAVANAPAIFLLHPRETSAVQMANLSRAGRLAASHGAWVFLPQAVDGQWHDDPSPTGAQAGGPDDVGFLSALIDRVVADDHLNPKQVYFAGYSNGGFMAERMACERTDKIAAIGLVAATFRSTLPPVCRPTLALPVVLMAGTSDPVVPYTGNLLFNSAAQSVQFWASSDRCIGVPAVSVFPQVSGDPTLVTLSRYTNCTSGSELRFYSIQNGGHTWPGSPYPVAALGNISKGIDATLELWKVFAAYHLP